MTDPKLPPLQPAAPIRSAHPGAALRGRRPAACWVWAVVCSSLLTLAARAQEAPASPTAAPATATDAAAPAPAPAASDARPTEPWDVRVRRELQVMRLAMQLRQWCAQPTTDKAFLEANLKELARLSGAEPVCESAKRF